MAVIPATEPGSMTPGIHDCGAPGFRIEPGMANQVGGRTILQLLGVDTYQEFVERHRRAMEQDK